LAALRILNLPDPGSPFFFTRPLRPFLRWAGGKQLLITRIKESVPTIARRESARLVEPFLGAGSVFFGLQRDRALLADANGGLISCFQWVKDNPDLVWRYLKHFSTHHSSSHYYVTRCYYNAARPSARKAAAFIYLNGACFNGVFRVNKKGEFNVPVGRRTRIVLPSLAHLRLSSQQLQRADLRTSDFEAVLDETELGDFVFIDPPYPALSHSAYFAHYTPERFNDGEQKRLHQAIRRLDNRGVAFMLTIASTSQTKRLYSRFHQKTVGVTRYVSGDGRTHQLQELFVSNAEMGV